MQDDKHPGNPGPDDEREPAGPADSSERRLFTRRRLVVGGLALGVLLLVVAGGTAGYVAHTNKQRADRWVEHASLLQKNVDSLETELAERTDDLNQRTEDLNGMAAKVQLAETAIARSEADVRSLEKRQRRLANEKAQVEDARAALAVQTSALEDVATAYVGCNSGLVELLNYVLADDFTSANAVVASVDADCANASDSLSGYLALYGD
jgi:septal ring factor EnvC (AmiA/AmiB activator)